MADLILYDGRRYAAPSFQVGQQSIANLGTAGLNNRAESAVSVDGCYLGYENLNFQGKWANFIASANATRNFDPLVWDDGTSAGNAISSVRYLTASSAIGSGFIAFFDSPNFAGDFGVARNSQADLSTYPGFNWDNKIESAIILAGDWRFADSINGGGSTVDLVPGFYADLSHFGVVANTTSSLIFIRIKDKNPLHVGGDLMHLWAKLNARRGEASMATLFRSVTEALSTKALRGPALSRAAECLRLQDIAGAQAALRPVVLDEGPIAAALSMAVGGSTSSKLASLEALVAGDLAGWTT